MLKDLQDVDSETDFTRAAARRNVLSVIKRGKKGK